jgi:3,4-dihydroxy 2-butanone 4-phosphate synthase / GTP cyclohydrolase II
MLGEDLDRLEVPMMVARNQDPKGTAYTVSVDAVEGTSTGISAADRARTCQVLADPARPPDDVTRPGHVFPLRYHPGGVLRRPGTPRRRSTSPGSPAGGPPGHLRGRQPDGSMARVPDLERFCAEHDLLMVTIADLIAYRRARETLVERVAEAKLPTPYGDWRMIGYRSRRRHRVDRAAVRRARGQPDVLVRMHSECLTGDVFRSLRCDCGPQLDLAMARIADEGRGRHRLPARPRGPRHRAAAQAAGLRAAGRGADTVDANLAARAARRRPRLRHGAMILADLGLSTLRLLTNNPAKRAALGGFGLSIVDRVPVEVLPNDANERYLRTKAERMGHESAARTSGLHRGRRHRRAAGGAPGVEKPAPAGRRWPRPRRPTPCRRTAGAGTPRRAATTPSRRRPPDDTTTGRTAVSERATAPHTGTLDASGLRVAIVAARFNEAVVERLVDGAVDALLRHGRADRRDLRSPGSPARSSCPSCSTGSPPAVRSTRWSRSAAWCAATPRTSTTSPASAPPAAPRRPRARHPGRRSGC